MEFAQASFLHGQPGLASSRIRIADPPPGGSAGDLYLVLEGGNERLCSNFADAAVRAYYSSDTGSAISSLMRCMRAGSSAAAAAAGPHEERLDLGSTGVVVRGKDLFIAQLPPTQLFIFRDNQLNSRPEPGARVQTPDDGLPFDKEIEILRADLTEGDVIVLTSSVVAGVLHEREIRGLLVRYAPEDSAYQIAALAAQRGATDCDILILKAESAARPEAFDRPPARPLRQTRDLPRPPATSAGRAANREPDWRAAEPAAAAARRPPRSALGKIGDFAVGVCLLILVLPVMAVKGIVRVFAPRSSGSSESSPYAGTAGFDSPPMSDYERRRRAIASGPDELDELNRQVMESKRENVLKPWPDAEDSRRGGIRGFLGSLFGVRDPLTSGNRPRSRFGPGALILLFSVAALIVVVLILSIRRGESPAVATNQTATAEGQAETDVEPERTLAAGSAANAFAEAKRHFDAAIRESERVPALAGLQDAIETANQAINAGYNEGEVNRLLAQIQTEQDRLNQVYRLVTSATIDEFNDTGVGIARIVPQLEVRQDIQYVIDAVEKRLIEYRAAKSGSVVLREGEQVGQAAVTDIIGMVARELSLLVIDSEFNVFSIVPDRPTQLLRVSGADQWKLPVAVDNFNNNMYILDPAANRIHKYQPTANGYEVEPIDYFDPSEDVDISTAIDMAIDGDVFVLLSDSTIERYRGGKKLRFQISGLDRPISKATRLYTDTKAESLYVVDDGNDRIVEIDKRDGNEGQFVRQFIYRGADSFFSDIRAIWVSELDGRLLVLGAESLRQFVLPKRAE